MIDQSDFIACGTCDGRFHPSMSPDGYCSTECSLVGAKATLESQTAAIAVLKGEVADRDAEIERLRSNTVTAAGFQRFEATEAVVEAAWELEHEIDQTYDVDDGQPNYPFGAEWQALRSALKARSEAQK